MWQNLEGLSREQAMKVKVEVQDLHPILKKNLAEKEHFLNSKVSKTNHRLANADSSRQLPEKVLVERYVKVRKKISRKPLLSNSFFQKVE